MTPTPDKVLIDRVIAGRLIDAAGFARQLAVGKLNSEGWDRIADHLRQALAAQPKAPSPSERLGEGDDRLGAADELLRLASQFADKTGLAMQLSVAANLLRRADALIHNDALANAARGLLSLIDELPVEPGGQQDRVFAEFEFDDLRAALESRQIPQAPSPTPGEVALRTLEKFHDKIHPQTDGWWCTLKPGCEIQNAIATLRAALHAQGWSREVPTTNGRCWAWHEGMEDDEVELADVADDGRRIWISHQCHNREDFIAEGAWWFMPASVPMPPNAEPGERSGE